MIKISLSKVKFEIMSGFKMPGFCFKPKNFYKNIKALKRR
jgi:hypothetical protein